MLIVIVGSYIVSGKILSNSNSDNQDIQQEEVKVQEKKYMSVQAVYDDFKKQDLQKDVSFIEVRKYKDDLIILAFGIIPNTEFLDEIGFITVQENSYIYSRKELWCYGYTDELEIAHEAVNLEENKRVSEIWNNQDLQYETLSNIETALYIDYFKNNKGTIENIKRQTSNNFTDKIIYEHGFSEETITDITTNSANIISNNSIQENNTNHTLQVNPNLDLSSISTNKNSSNDKRIMPSGIPETPIQPRSEQELVKEQIERLDIRIIPYGDENGGNLFYKTGGQNDISSLVNFYNIAPDNIKRAVNFSVTFDGLIEDLLYEDVNRTKYTDKHYMTEFDYKIQVTHNETGKSQTISAKDVIQGVSEIIFTDTFDLVSGNNSFNITVTDKYNNSKTVSNSFLIS